MAVFHSGQSRLVWHVLFEAGLRMDAIPEQDREVILISPWIRDLTTSQSGWCDLAVNASLGSGMSSVESLSDVLIGLRRRGFRVVVLTLSTSGKWLNKKKDKHLDEEIHMFEQLKKGGVECRLADNVHMKYLKTPLCVLSGSLNFSYNGVHGRTQEATNHFLAQTTDYEGCRRGIDNLLASSYPYDTEQGPSLTNWRPPEVDWFLQEIDDANIPDEAQSSHQESNSTSGVLEVEPSEFSGHTPSEIQDGSYLDDQVNTQRFLQAKYIQLLQRLGGFVLDTLQSRVDDETHIALEAAMTPSLEADEIGEVLPSLQGIKSAVESESFPPALRELLSPILHRMRMTGRRCLSESSSVETNLNDLRIIEQQIEIILR